MPTRVNLHLIYEHLEIYGSHLVFMFSFVLSVCVLTEHLYSSFDTLPYLMLPSYPYPFILVYGCVILIYCLLSACTFNVFVGYPCSYLGVSASLYLTTIGEHPYSLIKMSKVYFSLTLPIYRYCWQNGCWSDEEIIRSISFMSSRGHGRQCILFFCTLFYNTFLKLVD